MSSVKDRAIALFQKYDPAKVPKVDAILAKYAGKEEAFLKSLEKKYKEEAASKQGGDASAASSPTPAIAAAGGGGGSHKDRLIALLKKHDPEKVPKADAILAKYAGKEEAFLNQLDKKYNGSSAATTPAATPRPNSGNQTPRAGGAETPRAGSSHKDRLVAIFQKHDAAKIPKADAILAKYAGKEEAFLKQLEKKYESGGAGGSGKTTPRSSTPNNSARTPNEVSTPTTSATPPSAQPMTTKEKFVAIFQKHDATKVPMADALLAKHAGKEEHFIKQLLKKFGETEELFKTPAPAAAADKAPTPVATPRSIVTEEPKSNKPLSYKEQLVTILKAHAPEKVPNADAILTRYSGKEEVFLKQLEKKYENAAASSKSPTASTQPGSPTEPQEQQQPEQPPAPIPIQQEKTQEPEPEEAEEQQEQEQEQLAVSGKSTPIAGGSSNVTSGATTPRNTGLTSSSEQQQQSQTAVASAVPPPTNTTITYQQSEEDKRKLNRLESLRLATAEKFLETKINSDLRRNWFSLWTIAGRKRVAERIMNATKISNLPNQEALVQALAETKMTPGSYIKVRALRGHLGLGYDVPTPSDVNALTRYIDDTVASAIEFLTVTYPEELNRQQEAARAETQQLVGVLQEAQERVGEKEKEMQTVSDKLRFTQMNLEDAEKEIDNLHQANDAQVRLTNRANQQIRKLQDSLAKEQRGIPSELEQRMEQKDELAAHLHRELAAARASANKWKDQSEKMHLQLQEERDRRARAEQRVEVLSVALVPPEKLGLKSTAQHGTPAGGATPRISIAESVRNAREQQQHLHRDPSISSPGSASCHQHQQQQNSRTYQEQSRLLAAARKALITEGSATGGDVPRLLGINNNNNNNQQQQSTSPRREINEQEDDDDYVPPPPTTQPPATADRAGLNQTPAIQGAENNNTNTNQDQFFSPSPAASAAARTTATEETDSPYVYCPNCETVQLTAFNGSRFSANPTDADKVAFCFSCRKTFSKIDLEKAEKNRLRAAAASAAAVRQQSVTSSSSTMGTNQQLSKSRSAVARNQDKIPDALKKSVAKLQAQRIQKN